MTLILALRATDGVALVADTRKWFRIGGYVDGHRKLVATADGLLTGAGSGQLLDLVATQASDTCFTQTVSLIARAAHSGLWAGELADWLLTRAFPPTDVPPMEGMAAGIGVARFDGFSLRMVGAGSGALPAGLPAEFAERLRARLRPVLSVPVRLAELRTIAHDACAELHDSRLVSDDIDFGTHRADGRLAIERILVVPRRSRNSAA